VSDLYDEFRALVDRVSKADYIVTFTHDGPGGECVSVGYDTFNLGNVMPDCVPAMLRAVANELEKRYPMPHRN
jgi:hypothetical protein